MMNALPLPSYPVWSAPRKDVSESDAETFQYLLYLHPYLDDLEQVPTSRLLSHDLFKTTLGSRSRFILANDMLPVRSALIRLSED
ncbi:predicted protein [Botrytis cinerea T4]|uniref:Uncharacterized protein n=1 Tax=Botryotinia fuckeliana (strain T4) TaxID=999810 RepID=G2Y2X1_BOTF4|nr:predicted protein [Botrytis cinerea T4]